MPDYQVDTYGSGPDSLNVGVEVEYPLSPEDEPTFTAAGDDSSELRQEWDMEHGSDWPLGGRMTGDPTVGAEIVSDILNVNEATDWYANTIAEAEAFGYTHEPVGDMTSRSARTAGLHIHLSELSDEQARALYHISNEPWMQAFACTTLVDHDNRRNYKVFRGGRYCKFDGYDMGRYAAVHSVDRSSGHYEWRMPEPMTPDNFGLLMDFLRRLASDVDDAAEFARSTVMDADERLTSVRRAEAIGMPFNDEDEQEDLLVEATASRSPHIESEDFYWSVYDASNAPYIYRVDLPDALGGGTYYAFESHSHSSRNFHDPETGVEFEAGEILDAESLDPISSSEVAEQVREVLDRPIQVNTQDQQEPEMSEVAELISERLTA